MIENFCQNDEEIPAHRGNDIKGKRRCFIRKFRKKFKGSFKTKDKLRVNSRILAKEVRVVDEQGEMKGVFSLSQAIVMAEDKDLDLVEIAPKANPPTCKIMDYGKWKFKLSKKEKISRKNQVKIIIKEIQLRPRTDVHDLEIKMKKAKEFLLNGYKVKVHLRYSGREMAHKELGLKMLDKVKEVLLPYALLEKDTPQIEKRSAFLFFVPEPVKLKEWQKKKKAEQSKKTLAQKKPEPKAGSTSKKLDTKPLSQAF